MLWTVDTDNRLPTIVCRGNPDAAHTLVSSTLTHLFHQAFIDKMSNVNELILMCNGPIRQEAVREKNDRAEGKQLRERQRRQRRQSHICSSTNKVKMHMAHQSTSSNTT